jgi:N-acetylmuramoyl-L-alanine amidase
MKAIKVVLVMSAVLAAQSALAFERNLINDALNKTLVEHASAEQAVEQNPEISRPEQQAVRVKSGRIEVVIDSGIGGTPGSLKSHSTSNEYREKRVQVKLDKELESIKKDLAVSPESTKSEINNEMLN